jgi:hypothetical protein
MPLDVINGALDTHPYTVRSLGGDSCRNRFYDPAASRLSPADEAAVLAKLSRLDD